MGEKQNTSQVDIDSLLEILISGNGDACSNDLFEQGMNSSSVMQLLMGVRKQFAVDIELEEFLRSPTIKHLNQLIADKINTSKTAAAVAQCAVDKTREQQVQALIPQLVQLLDGKVLQASEDLFEQGLSSLNVMTLMMAVKKRFAVDIELDALLANPTLTTLATLIVQSQCGAETPAPQTSEAALLSPPATTSALSVLSSKAEKQAFKKQHLNIRQLRSNEETIRAQMPIAEQFTRQYNARRTFRSFDAAPLGKEQLLGWLSALNAMLLDDELRYLYPSAGGTYSIQTYIEIKPGKVAGCAAGFYYYNPQAYKLDKLSSAALSGTSHFYYNRPYYDHAHGCLYFVVEYDGIAPLYKEKSDFFTAIEIGSIIQLLEQKQADYQIGSCPLSGVNESSLAGVLALKKSQRPLMAVAFGRVDKIQPADAPNNEQTAFSQDIAIIGVQGQYPAAPDLQTFWHNLTQQRCCFSHVLDNRWHNGQGAEYWGGFVASITRFNADFFAINATEQEQVSPQEGRFLTTVYQLLDSAGYNGENLSLLGQQVGVFTGVMWNDPIILSHSSTGGVAEEEGHAILSSIANRVSWFFNWTGPSMAVDTGCSSSLTAIYLACQAIAQGECDCAVAGGINLFAHVSHFTNLTRFNMISTATHAPVFGEAAAGIIPGEGVGVVLLKPLSQAQKDGDAIWGVIKAGSIGHSGKVSGYGVPSPQQQRALMVNTLRKAGCEPETVDYIEAAAGGTILGDASEVLAIQSAFADRPTPLYVGTLKPNIGQLESASGISQLTKVLLQMKHGCLLPVLPYDKLNPLINLQDSPVHIIAKTQPWPGTRQAPCRALINSFGSTGVYACLLIQSYHPPEALLPAGADTILPEVFVLSARNLADLRRYVIEWLHFIATENPQQAELRAVFAITQCGRQHFAQRLAIPVSSWSELQTKLQQWLTQGAGEGIYQGSVAPETKQNSPQLAVTQCHEMAAAWVSGSWQQWHNFYQGATIPKVPLPGYPLDAPAGCSEGHTPLPVSAPPATEEQNDSATTAHLSPLPLSEMSEERLRTQLSALISQLLQRPLTATEHTASLFVLGVTSAQAVKLVKMVEQETGVALPMSLLLEKNSLDGLLTYLLAHVDTAQPTRQVTASIPSAAIPPTSATESAPQAKYYPLSEGQKGLWVVHQHAPENSAYNCPVCLRIHGVVDARRLQTAVDLLVRKYPILCSVIREEEGVPGLFIDPQRTITLAVMNGEALTHQQVTAWLAEQIKQPFNLHNGSLFRANLLTLAEHETLILLCAHHIIVDATSINPMISGLLDFYRQLAGAQSPVLPDRNDSWHDFVIAEQALLQSDEGQRRLAYWVDKLADAPASSKLLTDNSCLQVDKYQGESCVQTLPAAVGQQLKTFCAEQGVYLSTLFLSLFQLVIHRFSGQEDLLIGMPVDARMENHQSEQIGYYVYPIPVRSQLQPERGYSAWLKTLQQTILEGLAHALPFPVVTRALNLPHSLDDDPLFQIAFVYQNRLRLTAWGEIPQPTGGEAQIEHLAQYSQKGEYEFMLEIIENDDLFTLNINYNPTLYHQITVLTVLDQMQRLLKEVMAQPDNTLNALPMMGPKEQIQIQEEWNRTTVDYGEAVCIHTLFEQQVAKSPEALAVFFEGTALTYQQLDAKADQLAFYLQEMGVGPGTLVGVCLQRSIEMIVSLLAVLKAGGAYIPLEPDYPAQRLNYILQDSAMTVIITQPDYQAIFSQFIGKLVLLNAGELTQPAQQQKPNPAGITPASLCYVLYTSGSTGKPKGCLLPHSAIVNRLRWMQDEYQLNPTDNVLQKTPFSFDVSVWEFFWPLISGATLVIAAPGGHKDPAYLIALIDEQQITTCHFVPSMLNIFINSVESGQCSALRRIFTSGEALPYSVLESVNQKLQAKLHNLYGPTEAAIDVSYWPAEKRQDRKVPIGKPIANTQLYIVDSQMNLLPTSAPGELLIGGAGLAKGYLNLPELTAKCFIPNLFSQNPADKLYRTGDLARWLHDGNIEFLGRIDSQVKIRGFRIELAEIEACLKNLPAVKACAVVVSEDAVRGKSIIAYAVLHPHVAITVKEMTDYLKRYLPEFMVPAQLMILDELPVTSNGKLDRKALAAIKVAPHPHEAFVAPTTAVQRQLAEIWQQVLNLPQVGINDNFFEIGGHSLTAITLLSRIHAALPDNKISLLQFYQTPTISGIITQGAQPEATGVLSLLHQSESEPQLTLICVPYAGAAATVYQPLANALAEKQANYAIYGVTIPGNAFGSQPATEMSYETVAELCAREIMAQVSGKVAIYGHCVGSYLALEITRRLELKGREVEFLVVAAAFPLPEIIRYLPINDRWRHKSDESLWQLLKTWGIPTHEEADSPTARFLISRFRKDAQLAYQYEKKRGEWQIKTPLINLVSLQDPLTAKYAVRYLKWQRCAHTVSLAVLDQGHHYFIAEYPQRVADVIDSLRDNPIV